MFQTIKFGRSNFVADRCGTSWRAIRTISATCSTNLATRSSGRSSRFAIFSFGKMSTSQSREGAGLSSRALRPK